MQAWEGRLHIPVWVTPPRAVELTLHKYDIVDGLDAVGKRGVGGCDECVLGKIRRGAVDGKRRARNSKIVAKTRPVGRVERVVPGQRLYSDFFGPLPEKTLGAGVAFGEVQEGGGGHKVDGRHTGRAVDAAGVHYEKVES